LLREQECVEQETQRLKLTHPAGMCAYGVLGFHTRVLTSKANRGLVSLGSCVTFRPELLKEPV